jgi:excisionase family DNA binding protein
VTTWLTAPEAAEYVRAKNDRVIRNAVNAGDLPACRYGNAIRIDAADLDAWLKAQPWEPKS